MLQIEKLTDYTIPLYGNRRCLPYGNLHVNGSIGKKICPIKDGNASVDYRQFITYNRRRYYVKNAGELHYPYYVFAETNDDWEVE